MRVLLLVVAATLGGCLSVLPAPASTGIEKGLLGSCRDATCSDGFGCNDYGSCNDMCFEDEDCKEGWRCCASEDAYDTWDGGGTCPEAYACYEP